LSEKKIFIIFAQQLATPFLGVFLAGQNESIFVKKFQY